MLRAADARSDFETSVRRAELKAASQPVTANSGRDKLKHMMESKDLSRYIL
jgi:hypothetical protein